MSHISSEFWMNATDSQCERLSMKQTWRKRTMKNKMHTTTSKTVKSTIDKYQTMRLKNVRLYTSMTYRWMTDAAIVALNCVASELDSQNERRKKKYKKIVGIKILRYVPKLQYTQLYAPADNMLWLILLANNHHYITIIIFANIKKCAR